MNRKAFLQIKQYISNDCFVQKFPVLHHKIFSFQSSSIRTTLFHYGILFGPRESVARNGFCCGIETIQSMIFGKFKKPPLLSQGRLYKLLTITKTVKREIMLERDVPAEHGNAIALRYAF